MGILGIRGVPEKVGTWKGCVGRGEYVTVDRFCPLWALVCQILGVAQRPGFYCLCNWLTCLIRLMGTDQSSGGVELMAAFGL